MIVIMAIAGMGRGNEAQPDRHRDRGTGGEDPPALGKTETTSGNASNIPRHALSPFVRLTDASSGFRPGSRPVPLGVGGDPLAKVCVAAWSQNDQRPMEAQQNQK